MSSSGLPSLPSAQQLFSSATWVTNISDSASPDEGERQFSLSPVWAHVQAATASTPQGVFPYTGTPIQGPGSDQGRECLHAVV
jgi:hypothetical protein